MAHDLPPLPRPAHVAPVGQAGGSAVLRAGTARVDLTPALGLALAGHSLTSGHAQGAWGRLFATVLVIDDGKAERVALVAADLHTGTRWLAERVAALVAPATGVRVDRLFLGASHTHRGPGHDYANRVFDSVVSTPLGSGFDLDTSEALAQALAVGVRDACARLAPARVGYGSFAAWGLAWNRSYRAAVRNLHGIDPNVPGDEEANVRDAARRLNGGAVPPDPVTWPVPPAPAAPAPPHAFALDAAHAAGLSDAAPAGDVWDDAVAAAEPERTFARVAAASGVDLAGAAAAAAAPAAAATPVSGAWAGVDAAVERSPLDRLLVDARVHCVWAEALDGAPIGAFATFGATPAFVSRLETLYSADVMGEAVRLAEQTLFARFAGAALPSTSPAFADGATLEQARGGRVRLGLCGGALGDANVVVPSRTVDEVLRRRRDERLDACLALAREAAAALGHALVEACLAAHAALADALTIEVRYAELGLRGAAAGPGPGDVLAGHARFGPSVLAGSEFSAGSGPLPEGLVEPFHAADPHSPKPHLGVPLPGAPTFLPLRLVRLVPAAVSGPAAGPGPVPGELALAAVPAEPTAFAALAVADAVRARFGRPALPVVVASPAGDFGSYFSTEDEYRAQHYEGASVIWGRRSGAWLTRAFDALAAAPAPTPAPAGNAVFNARLDQTHIRLAGENADVPMTAELRDPALRADAAQHGAAFRASRTDPSAVLLRGAWRGARDANPPLRAGAFVVVEVESAPGTFSPLVVGGARVDDRNFGVLVVRLPRAHDALWLWSLPLRDAGALAGKRLRFRVIAPAPLPPPAGTVWPTAVV
ncbi:MAG TPA: neutral/alkaline non-lysosomal ceramidase N-terminal domain-containing protein [Myxococcota bacterium]|jgi:hypothetical protein|nr:neutral/alkaline non-lysosomal ceramidase N-terminal domain-containing protein [Myxococcota bacterium]